MTLLSSPGGAEAMKSERAVVLDAIVWYVVVLFLSSLPDRPQDAGRLAVSRWDMSSL
jgi:hypothetical protein